EYRKSSVRVKDRAFAIDGHRALIHRFDQDAIGLVGAFERKDLISVRSGYHEGVNRPRANGVESFLQLREPRLQRRDLARRPMIRFRLGHSRASTLAGDLDQNVL